MEKATQTSTRVIKDLFYQVNREKLDELWNSFLTIKSYDSISNQMLLMEKYEEILEIQTNESKTPIPLVTINNTTDIYNNSLLEKTITKIMRSKLCELTGLSITELLALPTYYLQMVFRSATHVAKDSNDNKDLIKQLNVLTKTKK